MQLSLRVTDLIELDKLVKFTSKKKPFENIYLTNKSGRLTAIASNGFSLRSVELSDVRKLSDINTQLKVDASLKSALKALIAELKKYPDQTINLSEKSLSVLS